MYQQDHGDPQLNNDTTGKSGVSDTDFGMLVYLARACDILYAILLSQDEEMYDRVISIHRKGGLIGPPPGINPDELIDPGNE